MKRTLLAIGLILLAAVIFSIWQSQRSRTLTPATVVDSTPLPDEIYAAPPINITVNTNRDLTTESRLSVIGPTGSEVTIGEVLIEDSQTALKRALKPELPNGPYRVRYTVCHLKQGCLDGRFSFTIDSAKQADYQDLRGQSEVKVSLRDLKFTPAKILVSQGTTITWTNHDQVGHFINTETHPEHTYFPAQNSDELAENQTFTTTFTSPGQYNYHCSAHVPEQMLGSIIVAQ